MTAREDHTESFRLGTRHLKEGRLDEAARAFEKAYMADREKPLYMSYYGMCAALKWGKIGMGLELCTRAIKREYKRAEYYLNLGKVYLEAGNKKGAITVFKKGLSIDPEHDELNEMLVGLGARKRAIIPFLKRSNPLNKHLGIFLRCTLPALFKSKGPRKKETNVKA